MDLISILCLVLIYLSAAWCGLIKQPEHIAIFLFSRLSVLERVVAFASSGGGQERYTHFENEFLIDPASILYYFFAALSSVFTRFLEIAKIFFLSLA